MKLQSICKYRTKTARLQVADQQVAEPGSRGSLCHETSCQERPGATAHHGDLPVEEGAGSRRV
jgi:hypothetical protein